MLRMNSIIDSSAPTATAAAKPSTTVTVQTRPTTPSATCTSGSRRPRHHWAASCSDQRSADNRYTVTIIPPSTTCGSIDSSGAATRPSATNKPQQMNSPVRDRPPACIMCSARGRSSSSGSPPTIPEATFAAPSASTSRRGSVRVWKAWSSARLLSTSSRVPIKAITRPALTAADKWPCSSTPSVPPKNGASVRGCGQAAGSAPVNGPSAACGSRPCSTA